MPYANLSSYTNTPIFSYNAIGAEIYKNEPCVGYIRVSSRPQEIQGGSLEEQEMWIRDYIAYTGMYLIDFFKETHSAKQQGRKEYDRMMKYIAKFKKPINIIVIFVDRAYRNPQDFALLDSLMRKNPNLRLHILSDRVVLSDRSSPDEKFMHWLSVGQATKYSQDLSIKVRFGNHQAIIRGFRPNKPPYGYRNITGKNIKSFCEIEPNEAKLVKMAFELYSTGFYTLDTLILKLRPLGFPLGRNGLSNMFNNVFYIGKFVYNDEIYAGEHEPIISKELFYKVQRILKRHESTNTPIKHEFAYSLMIKCWYDNHYLVGYIQKGKYVYYRCYCRQPKPECKNQQISEVKLEKQLDEIFENLKIPTENLIQIRKMLLKLHKEKSYFCEITSEQIQTQLEKAEKQKKLLVTKLIEGIIDDTTYKEMKMELDIKIDKLELEKQKVKDAPKTFVDYVETLLELCKDAPRLWKSAPPLKKRELLKIVCSNLQLKDGKLLVTLAPPFSSISKIKNNGQNFHSVHYGGPQWTRTTDLTLIRGAL